LLSWEKAGLRIANNSTVNKSFIVFMILVFCDSMGYL